MVMSPDLGGVVFRSVEKMAAVGDLRERRFPPEIDLDVALRIAGQLVRQFSQLAQIGLGLPDGIFLDSQLVELVQSLFALTERGQLLAQLLCVPAMFLEQLLLTHLILLYLYLLHILEVHSNIFQHLIYSPLEEL